MVMKSVFQVLQVFLAVHMYVSLVVRIMRNVVMTQVRKMMGSRLEKWKNISQKCTFYTELF